MWLKHPHDCIWQRRTKEPVGSVILNSMGVVFWQVWPGDTRESSCQPHSVLFQVTNADRLWFYLEKGLMGDLRADQYYNGEEPYGLRGFLNDQSNRIMGYATIRQIRIKKNTCGYGMKGFRVTVNMGCFRIGIATNCWVLEMIAYSREENCWFSYWMEVAKYVSIGVNYSS